MKKLQLERLNAFDRPIHRDRLDHLLSFIDERTVLRLPANAALEAFYRAKELTKRTLGWRPGRRRRDAERGEREVWVRDADYAQWAEDVEPHFGTLEVMKHLSKQFALQPRISILMPTYNTPALFLRDAIESVRAQVYQNWELCIADDASTSSETLGLLENYADSDPRIKVVFRKTNSHISMTSNAALELVTGEYVGLLDHDDMLTPDALFQMVVAINQSPAVDMLYSDEDKLSEENERFAPFFKPDWSPESFLSRMYTCHFGVYRTSIVRRIGGFRKGMEGSQDYDLVLRFTEQTQNIVHVPRILYHWRMHRASTAQNTDAKPYAFLAAKKALAEALKRRNQPGHVLDVPGFMGHYRVRYEVQGRPKVTIVIPTRDYANVLGRCLQSLFTRTKFPRFEVVIVDNGSVRPETTRLFDKWTRARPGQFKVVRDDRAFNFSALCNVGARAGDGRFLCFLNNDTEITEADWLDGLVEYAQQPEIGAVGPKLLYGDGTVQHAGVVLGLGGTAGHPHLGLRGNLGGYFGYTVCANNVAAVTGACLVVERRKFEAVGGFEEELAVAYNDVDLCLKLLDAGFRNVLLPNIALIHHESRSRGSDLAPEKWARMVREGTVLQQRWAKKFWRDPYYSPNLTLRSQHFEIAVRAERRGRPDAWSSAVHQLADVGFRPMLPAERPSVRLAPVIAAPSP